MPPTLSPWEFWRQTLKSPKRILAPMVDASELPWRLLSRKYCADLAYTPMLNAGIFVRDAKYRKEHLESCEEDRPLIVQFCANDPEVFLQAARLAESHCDGIDLNLGCPQSIAKRGHYGSFLQDEWDLISKMVQTIHRELSVPITCKVRIFPELEKSIEYAKMLEKSGCYALTVHGRTREQKGPMTGLANWSYIKAIKEAVGIPVIANGNIQYGSDVDRCIEETGVDAVMSAEGNLTNPAIFANIQPPVWQMAREYIDLVEKYPCQLSYARGHLFKIFHHCLTWEECLPYRELLASGNSIDDFKVMIEKMEECLKPYADGTKEWNPPADHSIAKLPVAPWLCQPYVRLPPEEHLKKMEMCEEAAKRKREESETSEAQLENQLSKKKLKRLAKLANNPKKQAKLLQHAEKRQLTQCLNCPNCQGTKCMYKLCKKCCKEKCTNEGLHCDGHSGMSGKRKETHATTNEQSAANVIAVQ